MTDRRSANSARSTPSPRRAGGFTLTEILVTISVIVVILAAAVPLFRFITGTRSVDAAQGQVAAMVAQARARALNDGVYTGVIFYLDRQTDRTVMALVNRLTGAQQDLDPLDNYKGYDAGAAYFNNPYPLAGQRAICLNLDNDEKRMLVRRYQRTNQDPGLAGSPPPQTYPNSGNTDWNTVSGGNLELVANADFQMLPVGVGLQGVNDPHGNKVDRYLRLALILFDPQGRLDSIPCAINSASKLGTALGLQSDLGTNSTWFSQFGLALYDLNAFRSQSGFSEGDSTVSIPGIPVPASGADEEREETWLDKNATIYMVGRSNGLLIRGE